MGSTAELPSEIPGDSPSSSTDAEKVTEPSRSKILEDDDREALFNDRAIGPAALISDPAVIVTTLHAIMLDIDLDLLRSEAFAEGATASPTALFEKGIGPMLDRHPVYARAEVRSTGRGLHCLVKIDPPVRFAHATERDRWAASVKIVQSMLPTDPHAPGITAMTRPLGARNGKTGTKVAVLRPGRPVAPDEVFKLVEEIRSGPFRVAATMVLAGNPATCPVCRPAGNRLGVRARRGHCYRCGKVTLAKLFDSIMIPARPHSED
jgi:hypothetical protein